jgi:signal transduction histidine kinase
MDEANGNINGLAKNYANISNTFYNIGNKEKSKQYSDSALIYYQRTNDISGMANVYNTLGALASDEKNYTLSNRYYALSLQYKKQVDDVSGMANTYINIGDNYKDKKAWQQAKSYYDTALILYKKNKEQEGISRALINQANLLTLMKDSAAVQKNAEADTAITHLESLQTRAEALYNLAVNAVSNGDYKKATTYYQQYFRLHDSLLTQQTLNAVYETETKYQAEKKQQQIDLLNKDAVIRQLEVNKKNQWLILSTAAFLLLLLCAYLYYRRFKIQKEQQLKDAVTEQQNLATKALFEGEQKERIRIARDLHDSIGQMLSVVKMQVSTLHASAKADEKELTEASLQLVDKTITEVRSISHNLIPEELNFGLTAAIEELCRSINQSGNTVVNFNYDKAVEALQLNKQTELSVYRIVQEVLSNMAKHAAATQIDVNIHAEENKILLQLKDNGKGFDTATIQQSKGIGWKNIMARVNLLNGNMQLQSEKITGTQIEITIPQ